MKKVSVCVLSYNHEKYIRQCLDSIISQKVSFEYELIVSDDASSDQTRLILSEYQNRYPNIIKLIYNKTNIGISQNYQQTLLVAQGKYIAFCEGDDFWCDETKLQTQVNFLDTHPDFGFVGTYNKLLEPSGKLLYDSYFSYNNMRLEGNWELYDDIFYYAKFGPVCRTMTICFRRSIIIPYLHITEVGNDLVLQTILSYNSKFARYKHAMAVYRLGSGISNNTFVFQKQLYYSDWYVKCRLTQKELFPNECNWDEDELKDHIHYIYLKNAINSLKFKEIQKIRESIKSIKFKDKNLYKYSSNICLVFCLYIYNKLLRIIRKDGDI